MEEGSAISEYNVAITESTNQTLSQFLLKDTDDEEICFATWYPAVGRSRYTAIIGQPIWPKANDRKRHGTVTASPHYLDRAKEFALLQKAGLAIIHTHPFYPGPPGYSNQDLHLEQDKLAREVFGVTGLPLVGMTLSLDGIWDARIYPRPFKIRNCSTVRIVGKNLVKQYHPIAGGKVPVPDQRLVRTVSVWGEERQIDLMRLKVGVIGVGSVGSAVSEILARLGVGRMIIMDYDKLKPHNLDRMPNADSNDIGSAKIDIVKCNVERASTNSDFVCEKCDFSVVEENGYNVALDCDVIFSCVDRPWPRQVLNQLAYTSLIPVVDGGVSFALKNEKLVHGMYRAQTVGPERACMNCLGAFDPAQVQMDRDGNFDDPVYIKRMEEEGKTIPQRQNIMPFVSALAGLETIQFVEMVTNLGNMGDIGQQPYNYYPGDILPIQKSCISGCTYMNQTGLGDSKRPYLSIDKSRIRELGDGSN